DGVDGSNGDDGDAAHLSVSLSVVDASGETPENGVFQAGEVGKLTVSATFDDFKDGSETHTVTVTAPTGFALGGVIGELPAGVTIQSANATTVVLAVDSKDGDGQDGVGSFSVTFEVTNDGADDGVAQFEAEAKAVETNTAHPDVECDPSAADNVAVATDSAAVTVEDAEPVIVEATNSLLDEDDLVPDGSDQTAEPTGDRIDEGTIEVAFSND